MEMQNTDISVIINKHLHVFFKAVSEEPMEMQVMLEAKLCGMLESHSVNGMGGCIK